MISDMAHKESQKVYEEDQGQLLKDAMTVTKKPLGCLVSSCTKFENFKAGKELHDFRVVGERSIKRRFLIFAKS